MVNKCGFSISNSTFYMNYQEFRIVELRSSGVENLNDEKIAELILLEEEEDMNTSIYPMLKYYSRYICKQPTSSDQGKR